MRNSKELTKQLKAELDEISIRLYDKGYNWRLPVSLIGHDCKRYLWYIFRWCFREKLDGRMYRLTNRGNREEEVLLNYLRELGFTVYSHDENGEQYHTSAIDGHFGGSLDGIAYFPERYGIKEPVLLEFKTKGTGKGFSQLCNLGMQAEAEEHYKQACTYASDENYKFKYILYFVVNKNDDDIYIELVDTDNETGNRMRDKAEIIIMSQTAPARLSENPTFHKCQYCKAKKVCFDGEIVPKNCRSCSNAFPVENAEFKCSIFNDIIPRNYVSNPSDCKHYKAITRNV